MPALALIPTNISDSCSTLLTQLNSDDVFQTCTAPLIAAANAYTQSTNGTSSATLTSTLDEVCAAANGCDRPLVQQFLAQFWDACTAELEAQDADVMQLYDYLYIFVPFRDAVCAKDNQGGYCLPSMAPGMAPSANEDMLQLYRRGAPTPWPPGVPRDVTSDAYWAHVMATIPRANDSSAAAAPSLVPEQLFFFLSGSTPKDVLCTECTQHVLSAYVAFELATPYAPGLESSAVLQSQQAIYDHARTLCGADFVHTLNQQAGVEPVTEWISASTRAAPLRPWLLAALSAAAVYAGGW